MRRRELLAGAAAVLVAGRDEEPGARAAPWSSGSETPRLKAPPGATDCHHYVYDRRYPAFSDTIKRPDDATPHDYRALMRRLGITRQVLVQPSAYGADNRCLLEALAAFGGETRAVAVVDAGVADAVLKRFDRLGVRGLYFNFAPSNGATTATMIEPLARRIAPLGSEFPRLTRSLADFARLIEFFDAEGVSFREHAAVDANLDRVRIELPAGGDWIRTSRSAWR